MNQEVFKIIPDFPNYEVSNLGRVRNTRNGNILQGSTTRDGYKKVSLYKTGKVYSKFVHRIVAQVFIENPNPEEYDQIDHINDIRDDNRAENLRWVSLLINNQKESRRERLRKVKSIKVRHIETGLEYDSILEAERKTGISHTSIGKAIRTGCAVWGTHWEIVEEEE